MGQSVEEWWQDRAPSDVPRAGATEWPYGNRRGRNEFLGPMLGIRGRHCAREALAGYVADDLHGQLDAAVNAGTAVELMVKSYLYSISPATLAMKGDLGSVLVLDGMADRSGTVPTRIKTVAAARALQIATHLSPTLKASKADDSVFEVRNAAIHLGIVDEEELHRAVRSMCRIIDSLLSLFPLGPEEFWGPDVAGIVTMLLDQERSEIAARVQAKRDRAMKHLQAIGRGLSSEDLENVLQRLTHVPPTWVFAGPSVRHPCPVCTRSGHLLCEAAPAEIETEDGYAWEVTRGYPVAFECTVCNLKLRPDELREMGHFPHSVILSAVETDYPEYEPDEDAPLEPDLFWFEDLDDVDPDDLDQDWDEDYDDGR